MTARLVILLFSCSLLSTLCGLFAGGDIDPQYRGDFLIFNMIALIVGGVLFVLALFTTIRHVRRRIRLPTDSQG
jgi:hypothetical protein